MAKETKKSKIEEFKYEAEMSQLLNIIINSLYTHREVFLRELISNSCDALSKVRVEELTNKDILDAEQALKISLNIDEKKGVLEIDDNGIGMDKEELKLNLGTIAKSGTKEFLGKLKGEKSKATSIDDLIGQFGVGFYSVFMVCDEIIVESRSMNKDSQGFRWTSSGQGSYQIEPIKKENRGTKIIVKFNKNGSEFKSKFSIEQIVKKYSDFVPFPIYMEEKLINQNKAIWQKNEKDTTEEERNEFYKYLSKDFENPLAYKFLNIEGKVMFKALIFVPSKAPFQLFREQEESTLHLYVHRVFIQDNCKELLPQYLRFVKGVVDTESLNLNISREVTQKSPVMKKIESVLTSNILKMIEKWSEKDNDTFLKFYKEFGLILKEGIHYDLDRKERLIKLMRFESSALDSGELTSLSEYVSRMRSDQKEIYYIFGQDRETMLKNPNLEYCRSKDLEVLLLTDPIDEFLMPGIREFEGKPIQSVLKAEFKEDSAGLEQKDKLGEADINELTLKIKEVLGDKIQDVKVSNRLVDSPATLVPPKDSMDPHMERMMKMMNKEFKGSKYIFEFNPANKIIQNISAKHKVNPDNPAVKDVILHLYHTAQLMDGNLTKIGNYIHETYKFLEDVTKI
jgi:molecular chaperone HtpG